MANYPVKLLKDKNGTAFIPVVNSDSIITPEGNTLNDLLEEKQDVLVSGTNIKTINGNSILGNGDISLAGGETLKVGTILPFSGSTLPTGYLFCDGSAISRTTYAGLFDVIGTTFGSGDGSTTFNLPNLKGKVPVGLDSNDTDFDTLGETGGEKTHTLTVDEMPSHTHTPSVVINANSTGYVQGPDWSEGVYTRSTYGASLALNNTGGSQPHNNLQPYIVINYIIKATQTTPAQAQTINEYSESTTDGYSAHYINQRLDAMYPVGSIYMSVNSTNPSTLFGGTWEQLEDKFLIGASSTYSAGSTGGDTNTGAATGDTGSTTLTINQIPSHTHTAKGNLLGGVGTAQANLRTDGGSWTYSSSVLNNTGGGKGHTHTLNNHTHTNMPPYLAVYMWKRVA